MGVEGRTIDYAEEAKRIRGDFKRGVPRKGLGQETGEDDAPYYDAEGNPKDKKVSVPEQHYVSPKGRKEMEYSAVPTAEPFREIEEGISEKDADDEAWENPEQIVGEKEEILKREAREEQKVRQKAYKKLAKKKPESMTGSVRRAAIEQGLAKEDQERAKRGLPPLAREIDIEGMRPDVREAIMVSEEDRRKRHAWEKREMENRRRQRKNKPVSRKSQAATPEVIRKAARS